MSIKAAIEALDRATPGPWHTSNMLTTCIMSKDDMVAQVFSFKEHFEADKTLIAAAPQMAALIKRMVPYIERCRAEVRQIIAMDWHDKGFDAELAELDAILKEAGE